MLGYRIGRRSLVQDADDPLGRHRALVTYGILQEDWVIILANTVSLLLLFGILFFKLRAMRRDGLTRLWR